MAVRSAAAIVAILADALHYSHEHGVIHRDLKPANVMLAPLPEGTAEGDLPFCPRLTDFGLAKLIDASLQATRSSVVLGTPHYMAPEQGDDRPAAAGPAVDVYGLGVLLYELLTGRPPFEGGTALSVLERIRKEPPAPLRRARPDVARDLETICLRCLEKDPERRYPSAGELAADLQRFLEGRPIRARRPGLWERVQNWSRRPERMRDAGVYGVVLNVLMPLSMLATGIFLETGLVTLSTDADDPVMRDNILLGILFHLPLIWMSVKILNGSHRAIQIGILISGVEVAYALACLVGPAGITPYGSVYSDPNVRRMAFNLLALLFGAQLGLLLLAWRASRALRARG